MAVFFLQPTFFIRYFTVLTISSLSVGNHTGTKVRLNSQASFLAASKSDEKCLDRKLILIDDL